MFLNVLRHTSKKVVNSTFLPQEMLYFLLYHNETLYQVTKYNLELTE